MRYMFSNARSFNQNLNSWDVENVQFFMGVFANATSFAQPVCWNVSLCGRNNVGAYYYYYYDDDDDAPHDDRAFDSNHYHYDDFVLEDDYQYFYYYYTDGDYDAKHPCYMNILDGSQGQPRFGETTGCFVQPALTPMPSVDPTRVPTPAPTWIPTSTPTSALPTASPSSLEPTPPPSRKILTPMPSVDPTRLPTPAPAPMEANPCNIDDDCEHGQYCKCPHHAALRRGLLFGSPVDEGCKCVVY